MNPQIPRCPEDRDSVSPCNIQIEQDSDSDSEGEDEGDSDSEDEDENEDEGDSDSDSDELNEMELALDGEYKPWDHVVVDSCDGFSQMLYLALQVLDNLVKYCDQRNIPLLRLEHLWYYKESPVHLSESDIYSIFMHVEDTVQLLRQYIEDTDLHTDEMRGEFQRTMAKESEVEQYNSDYNSIMRFTVINYMRSMIERH